MMSRSSKAGDNAIGIPALAGIKGFRMGVVVNIRKSDGFCLQLLVRYKDGRFKFPCWLRLRQPSIFESDYHGEPTCTERTSRLEHARI